MPLVVATAANPAIGVLVGGAPGASPVRRTASRRRSCGRSVAAA